MPTSERPYDVVFLAGCIHRKVHETNKFSDKLPFEPWPCFQNMTSLMQQLDLPDTGSGQGLLPGPHQVPGSSLACFVSFLSLQTAHHLGVLSAGNRVI